MLELVEPLLQADLLHLQQGAILDFIQREAVLLSKVIDQRVLWAGRSSGELVPGSLTRLQTRLGSHLPICLEALASPSPRSSGIHMAWRHLPPTRSFFRSKVPPFGSGSFPDPSHPKQPHPSWGVLAFPRVCILIPLWDSWDPLPSQHTHTHTARPPSSPSSDLDLVDFETAAEGGILPLQAPQPLLDVTIGCNEGKVGSGAHVPSQ